MWVIYSNININQTVAMYNKKSIQYQQLFLKAFTNEYGLNVDQGESDIESVNSLRDREISFWQVLAAVADNERGLSLSEDFERMLAMVIAEEVLFKDTKNNDFYYDLFLTARWCVQCCKVVLFNRSLRKELGLSYFDHNDWIGCWNEDKHRILEQIYVLFSRFDVPKNILDLFGLENTTFMRTLAEYYSLSDISTLSEMVTFYTKAPDFNLQLSKVGWFRGTSSTSLGWHRFLFCIYLIDYILESSSQFELIENHGKKSCLKQLIHIGEDLSGGESWGTYKTDLDGKKRLGYESFDMHHRFYRQKMIISLMLDKSQSEIYAICSEQERYDYDRYILRISFFVKSILFQTSGEHKLESVFLEAYRELCKQFGAGDIYPIYSQRNRCNKTLAAEYLLHTLSENLKSMPLSGIGAIKRVRGSPGYKILRKRYLEVYTEFGLHTHVPKSGAGRRTAILYPQQNKKLENLHLEIEYLPLSLSNVISKMESMESVLTLPYITLLSYDHVFRFSRCIYSVGKYDVTESWNKMTNELRRIVKIFESSQSRGNFVTAISDLVHKMENSGKKGFVGSNREEVVSLQNAIKHSFLNHVASHLRFPDLYEEIRVQTM